MTTGNRALTIPAVKKEGASDAMSEKVLASKGARNSKGHAVVQDSSSSQASLMNENLSDNGEVYQKVIGIAVDVKNTTNLTIPKIEDLSFYEQR